MQLNRNEENIVGVGVIVIMMALALIMYSMDTDAVIGNSETLWVAGFFLFCAIMILLWPIRHRVHGPFH